ncbi:MAG: FkbM family methyltransferase [Rhodospirillaceae bacterium]|jgi:FkbM family methyltransferase|nr:FkbM family methyltransferase [Rhodospirillaceae bacterium]MBT6138963.1 FkbM family methyltransferase [Rhodospirillaceae bacterium]
MSLRWLRKQIDKVGHRLFLLEEYASLARAQPVPSWMRRRILGHPASAEDWIQLLRFFDPDESLHLIDVGAHTGAFTADFLDVFPKTKAVCIEPASVTFKRLAERYSSDERVECVRAALGSEEGEFEMTIYPESPELNSFHKYADAVSENYDTSNSQVESVPCRRIDTLSEVEGTTIVKIDTQGHEVAVIEGSPGFFAGVEAVLCECSFAVEYENQAPSFARISGLLGDVGLHPIAFQSFGNQISNYAFERDVLFVRQARLDRIFFRNY